MSTYRSIQSDSSKPARRLSPCRGRSGVTMTEVVVATVILLVVSTTFVPAGLFTSRETSKRIKCANNLRQIALASLMYSNAEVRTGTFARTLYDRKTVDKPKFYTRWDQPDSFGDKGPEANDVTAGFYLLLKTQDISYEVFVCPSSPSVEAKWDTGKKSFLDLSNFDSPAHLSYSYSNPYPADKAVMSGWKFNNTLGADFVLAADMNPGGEGLAKLTFDAKKEDLKQGNSKNHDQAGQNVVYCDGHVEFQTTPFCGPQRTGENFRDNIYTCGVPAKDKPCEGVVGPAADLYDAVLLPTADEGKAAAATVKPGAAAPATPAKPAP